MQRPVPWHANSGAAWAGSTIKRRVRRIRDIPAFLAARSDASAAQLAALAKMPIMRDEIELDTPNVTDRRVLLTLAHMATEAYYRTPDPIPDAPQWHWSSAFGWDKEGLRGHVFATQNNETVVVALKGTSASFLPGGATGGSDKENDNLLFSCCCARVTDAWSPVCDCFDALHKCDTQCVGRALIDRSLYYPAATELYNNMSYMYPHSQLWITGHSLGGVIGGFMGITFGVPAVTFETPGDRIAAERLHLPLPPPSYSDAEAYALAPVTHVYHTADALATGQCVGANSLCSRTGFAIETKCHTGQSIVYDTVGKLSWGVGVLSHRIVYVMEELLSVDWDVLVRRHGGKEQLPPVPDPARESACQDCSSWSFT
ncbi:Atg15p [Malassezia vespertilionis]|uniref:triacylglycerol lipase n=1 Tax=Malassezia vespertilionis TaxID=2020962 RepID=A0A2N1J7J0_9BASI|nr:Atg15p [Malassezia vespertilionis]